MLKKGSRNETKDFPKVCESHIPYSQLNHYKYCHNLAGASIKVRVYIYLFMVSEKRLYKRPLGLWLIKVSAQLGCSPMGEETMGRENTPSHKTNTIKTACTV